MVTGPKRVLHQYLLNKWISDSVNWYNHHLHHHSLQDYFTSFFSLDPHDRLSQSQDRYYHYFIGEEAKTDDLLKFT